MKCRIMDQDDGKDWPNSQISLEMNGENITYILLETSEENGKKHKTI